MAARRKKSSTTSGDGPSFFARYIDEPKKPRPETPPPVPLAAGRLLHWLKNNWKGSTIKEREIRIYGPGSIRDRESTLRATEVLVRHGWLVPMKTGRYDSKRWQLAIGD